MGDTHVTRGRGRLEGFLSRVRARTAERLIPDHVRGGAVLDIGCGSYPLFLSRTRFAAKFGVDQLVTDQTVAPPGVTLQRFDVHGDERLPFEDAAFSAVTMLAVFEHLREDRLVRLLHEIDRVTKPRGVYVMTTPAAWAAPLLRMLAGMGMVSREELDEHVREDTPELIRKLLAQTPMGAWRIEHGYFECFLNIRLRATKPG